MLGLGLKNIKKSFGSVEVIRGIDLTINPGEFTVFVGPSGCGKSTLLRMIAGLEDVSSGKITFGDDDATEKTPAERRVALTGFDRTELMFPATGANELAEGAQVTVGIRPEHFTDTGEFAVRATVRQIEDLGGTRYAYCRDRDGHLLTVEIDRFSAHAEGQEFAAGVTMSDAFLFSTPDGRRIR